MYFTSEADLGIKAGFCRPLQYKRAGAPRYKGARPYSCGRAAKTSKNVLFSLLPGAFLPVFRLFYPSCKARPFFVSRVLSLIASLFYAKTLLLTLRGIGIISRISKQLLNFS